MDKLENQSKILFLGEGEGRNAIYAALKGHEATALDASSIGLEKAKQLSKEYHVEIKTIHTDLAQWQPPIEQYDVMMSSYMHLMEPLRTVAFHKAMEVLKEGGGICWRVFFSRTVTVYIRRT
ncbi:class I SAM-dependent methyltransferase [Hydrogenimonas thermophila]|uniref:class I SAM-dependent methyltransferase n=1 Tax=Hydrogenimonas thermophila TaxID=223786 RepID=UPI000B82BDA3